MSASEQSETIRFVESVMATGGEPVETIVTHISRVFLAGPRALKLKRAVALPYLDLSTPERRLALARREFELNRRTAPDLYRGVHRITREADGTLALDGAGPLVDAVLAMRRFDQSLILDDQARQGRLTPADMAALAASVAALHGSAEPAAEAEGTARMERVLALNERAFAETSVLPREDCARLTGTLRAALARLAPLIEKREREGRVRRCHGDLHLRNIYLAEGKPVLFDCLEFDEDLATTDVLYDLAFVLMDLWHRGLAGLANALFNRYLDITGDEADLALLPFFMAVRASVRAHVSATSAARADEKAEALTAEARAYLDLGLRLLDAKPAILVAVGGFSGSGKSTVAAALAPHIGLAPGARIASSDRLRKRLFGVAPETRLPPEAYRAEASARTYDAIGQTARAILPQGWAVVADAVFDRQEDRDRMAWIAREAGLRFQGVWLDAPEEVLIRRVAARRGDPSDATPDVVLAQIARRGAAPDWPHLAADRDAAAVAEKALALIGA
ncbi:AAA family ATPase [Enterovirga rhinocerotis]|uniref:Aminoglycoside phosphotransferase domain-containing protein n=1 Tax=Enterovirga rhinocerotis TaxID=1339210 RepID=A0A4R7C8V3_9HYPH|nr:bifunctional aminoglycoside phosphotransferase/ATP-binding protein [Enterovirga rhinocerotis]TDR93755.1 hypothetical protein EV668_1021 [Enterovirga rhinocerotis]